MGPYAQLKEVHTVATDLAKIEPFTEGSNLPPGGLRVGQASVAMAAHLLDSMERSQEEVTRGSD